MRSLTDFCQTSEPVEALRDFRELLHGAMLRRKDALFELTDAILTAGLVPSPPYLSLVPAHRRGWVSLYAALAQGAIDDEAIGDLLASHAPGARGTPVYAVDVSPWPRCDAERSPGRAYLYHSSRHSADQPIAAGLSFERDSWVAPADAGHVLPEEDANDVAASR